MVRPRWQDLRPSPQRKLWNRWDQVVAILAAANVSWVIFDITYIHLRNFWLNRTLFPIPSVSLVVPLTWLPDITPFYDQIKGIQPKKETQEFITHFNRLDRTAAREGIDSKSSRELIKKQVVLGNQIFQKNLFVNPANLEKLRVILKAKAQTKSAKEASTYLFNAQYLASLNWKEERIFWRAQVLPLLEKNYIRTINLNGQPIDLSWKVDAPFQLLFLLDILIRALRLKVRFPGISWRESLLRRWIDLPLIIPFWRLLRLVPVTERLSNAALIQLEPLRAVISRGVVALLALELFEVFTVRVVDAMQGVILSPRLPQRIRSLCSHQSVESKEEREITELLRLWLPVLLTQVGPSMRPQLVALFGHALQRSMEGTIVPSPLKGLSVVEKAESVVSYQLAAGMIDAILDISQNAGKKIGRKDLMLEKLGVETLDRFWEELARAMESAPVLERSQELIVTFLEEFKRSSFRKLKDQGGVEELITELDGLNFSSATNQTKPLA